MSSSSSSSEDPICIGDYITLYASKPNEGWLGFEGMFGSNCFLSSNPTNFEDCLWQVSNQHQYSAVNEYEAKHAEFQSEYNVPNYQSNLDAAISEPTNNYDVLLLKDSKEVNSIADKKRNDKIEGLKLLNKAALNEIRLNEKLLNLKIGNPIAFGDVIQLIHVKSGRFLTVNSHQLAKVEKENMFVGIKQRGDERSYLTFSPRFKYDKDGQAIMNHVEANIRVVDRPGEYIHAAKKSLNIDGEVNCSLDSTSWLVSVYYKHNVYKAPRDTILGGELIVLQDIVNIGCLASTLNSPTKEIGDVIISTQYVLSEELTNQNVSYSSLYWVIEKEKLSDGGPIVLGEDLVTFRHLNSNLYLQEQDGKLYVVQYRENSSFFRVISTAAEMGFLRESMPVNIRVEYEDTWICIDPDGEESNCNGKICECSELDKANAITFHISSGRSKHILNNGPGCDLYLGVEASTFLGNFSKFSKLLVKTGGNFSEELYGSFGLCKGGLKEAFQFLNNLHAMFLNVSKDAGLYDIFLNKCISKEVKKKRQILFKEQEVIDVILDLIEFASRRHFDHVSLKRRNTSMINFSTPTKSISQQSAQLSNKKTVIIDKKKGSTKSGPSQDVVTDSDQESSVTVSSIVSRLLGTIRRDSVTSSSYTLSTSKERRQSISKRTVVPQDSNSFKNRDRAVLDSPVFQSSQSLSSSLSSSSLSSPEPNTADSPSGEGRPSFIRSQRSTIRKSISNLKHLKENTAVEINDDADQERSFMSLSEELIHKLLLVLFEVIQDNFENQLHVSSRLNILINQINSHKLAVDCLNEILFNNLQILQASVYQKEINMFLDLLLESKMNVVYLRLISTLCRAPMGVDSTQRMVSQTLFKHFGENAFASYAKYKSLTFNINSDFTDLTHQAWPNSFIYIPSEFLKSKSLSSQIKAFNLFSDGLPRTSVSWEFDAFKNAGSPTDMYGTANFVEISMICDLQNAAAASESSLSSNNAKLGRRAVTSRTSFRSNMGGKNSAESKKQDKIYQLKLQACSYLVAQLYLVADVCLDRNYISINILKKGYKLETLLAILKQENVSDELKAPICRIFRCMYLDREPQVTVKYPKLIRIAANVKKELARVRGVATDMAESYSAENTHSFAILQCIISEYLHKHASSQFFNEYSVEITDSLNDLIKFGFYSADEHILDIIEPLIKYLQPRNMNTNKPVMVANETDLTYKIGIFMKSFENWESKFMEFQDSVLGLVFYLSVVIITVTVATSQLLLPTTTSFQQRQQFAYFDLSMSMFFLSDIVLRIYCHIKLYLNLVPFFRNPFNLIDFVLVALDMTLLGLGSQNSLVNSGRFFRFFKIMRLLRLLRLIRAAKLVKNLADKSSELALWKVPPRFERVTTNELDTKINITSIISKIFDRIHDSKLDFLIQAFIDWKDSDLGGRRHEPLDSIAGRVISHITTSPFAVTDSLDDLLLDAIMYDNPKLIKESLNLLRIQKSSKDIIMSLCNQVQIIYSPDILNVHNTLFKYLRDFKNMGEMYEIWGKLDSADNHQYVKMVNATEGMLNYVRRINDDQTLDIKSKYIVDIEVQMFLFNLDFMDSAMIAVAALYDGGREFPPDNVIELLKSICELICWFVQDNPNNQIVAYSKGFDWFLKRMNDLPDIKSSKVIREILRNNRDLGKQFPRTYLLDMATNILNQGHNPDYLDMYLGLVGVGNSLDDRYLPIEQEITKYLSGQKWKSHLLLYCTGGGGGATPGSSGYNKRKSLMEVYANFDCAQDDLHSELRYHISLVKVLARCRLGPKLQAIYNCDDILKALIDPATIIHVKTPLLYLFVDYLITDINIAKSCETLWLFFDNISLYFERSISTLPNLLSQHDIEMMNTKLNVSSMMLAMMRVLERFFYSFNFSNYNADVDTLESQNLPKNRRSDDKILETLKSLTESIKSILKIDRLGDEFKGNLRLTLDILNSAMRTDPAFQEMMEKFEQQQQLLLSEKSDQVNPDQITEEEILSPDKYAQKDSYNNNNNNDGVGGRKGSLMESQRDFLGESIEAAKMTSINEAIAQRAYYKRQFDKFMTAIVSHPSFNSGTSSQESISLFEKIYSVRDLDQMVDFRLEPLISRISSFVKSHIKRSLTSTSLDVSILEITIWYIRTLRELLEKHMKVTIDIKEVLLNTPDVISASCEKFRMILADNGIIELCLELTSNGIPPVLSFEAMKLLTILLTKPGGCPEIQKIIYENLNRSDSTIFMEYILDTIEEVRIWTQKSVTESKYYHTHSRDKNAGAVPNGIIVFFFIQVLCDGSNLSMSDYFREQRNNYKQLRVLDTLSNFADYLSRHDNEIITFVSIHVLTTIKKLMHGPCEKNQEEFVLKTELLLSLNRYIRQGQTSTDAFSKNWNNALETLRERIVEVLITAIAGQSKHSVIFDKVTTTIEFTVFNMILLPSEGDFSDDIINLGSSSKYSFADGLLTYKLSNVQCLYLVFLNSLGDAFGSLLPQHISNRDVYKIDIYWRNHIDTRSFYIPELLNENNLNIDKLSDHLHNHIEENQENSLKSFMSNCRQYYKEALHQRFLQKFGIPNVSSINYWVTWLMFLNAIVMNILMLKYITTHEVYKHAAYGDDLQSSYQSPSYAPTYKPSSYTSVDDKYQNYHVVVTNIHDQMWIEDEVADVTLSVLNIIQVIFVLIVIATLITNTMPVSYSLLRESGHNIISSVLRVLFTPLILWYCCYLLLTLIAIKYNPLFLSGLLLDWVVLDATTRDVLRSVKDPARQLFATLIIIMILLNMFAGIVFYFYRQDVVSFDIYSMWDSLKLCISYGIRGEYGISHEMYNTLGSRIALDLVFYFVILAILRHIFFAIIVDTFSELREKKLEIDKHAVNCCFICGIERHEFEKKNSNVQVNAFSNHRNKIHNPISYFYYMVYIWEKSRSEDTGMDSYVRHCLEVGDISWFPMGISSDLLSHQDMMHSKNHLIRHDSSFKFDQLEDKKQQNGKDNDKEGGSDRDVMQKLTFVQSQVTKLVLASDKPGSDDLFDIQKTISLITSSLSLLQSEIKDLSAKVHTRSNSITNDVTSPLIIKPSEILFGDANSPVSLGHSLLSATATATSATSNLTSPIVASNTASAPSETPPNSNINNISNNNSSNSSSGGGVAVRKSFVLPKSLALNLALTNRRKDDEDDDDDDDENDDDK